MSAEVQWKASGGNETRPYRERGRRGSGLTKLGREVCGTLVWAAVGIVWVGVGAKAQLLPGGVPPYPGGLPPYSVDERVFQALNDMNPPADARILICDNRPFKQLGRYFTLYNWYSAINCKHTHDDSPFCMFL